MKIRFPLYAKILLWFFLNLVFLGLVFYVFFRVQFRLGLDSLLLGRAGERIQAISEVVTTELNRTPRQEWSQALEKYSDAYQIQLALFRNDGDQVAGPTLQLPKEVAAKVAERGEPFGLGPGRGRGGGRQPAGRGPAWERGPESATRGPPAGRGFNRPLAANLTGPFPKFLLHTDKPDRYWIGVRLPTVDQTLPRPAPLVLLAISSTISAGGLILDLTPWIVVGLGAFCFSALFWIPLVRGITRSISQMTRVTEQIAEGRFDSSVETRRQDELGRLGSAINRMAVRLAGFVTGQKRFLGDIAHELCAPIARIQMALGILEQRADAQQLTYVEDLREEVQQMSGLINELLSFSKAGLQPKEIALQSVNLGEIVRKVIAREAAGESRIDMHVPDGLRALAEPELLTRALANLVRNALRYGGPDGTILVSAEAKGDQVIVVVADQGPGVPEETLDQIFDPFFRLETSRSRDTGGVGLGLAIVKTCIEACQGTVTARNRQPSGLWVEVILKVPQNRSNRSNENRNPQNGLA